MEKSDHPQTITQTIVNGVLGSPTVFTISLMASAFLLGAVVFVQIISQIHMYEINSIQRDSYKDLQKEIKMLSVDVQKHTAELIASGVIKPDDSDIFWKEKPKEIKQLDKGGKK